MVSIKLTEREREIAAFVRKGFSSKKIASELNISYKTVEVHRYHLLKKTESANSIEMLSKLLLYV